MTRESATLAALGLRVHSGWAAVVAVTGDLNSPAVLHRARLKFADPKLAGSKQPYHAAEKLDLKQAEKLLQRCSESSSLLAKKTLGDVVDDVERRGAKVSVGGVLLSSGRPLGTLAATLASHALIHTAEGEFFRTAVIDACKHHRLQVIAVKERELLDRFHQELHLPQAALDQHLAAVGKAIGPPWREDQKLAMLVGWLALAAARGTSE